MMSEAKNTELTGKLLNILSQTEFSPNTRNKIWHHIINSKNRTETTRKMIRILEITDTEQNVLEKIKNL